jgi:hypothetical protein
LLPVRPKAPSPAGRELRHRPHAAV